MNILSFEIDSLPVDQTLVRIEKLDKNLAPTAQAGLKLRDFIIGTYRDERDPWGMPWPKLSAATLANRKRRGNFGLKPLVDSEKTYDSIQVTQTATDVYVAVTNASSYPRVHQFGNPDNRAWGGPPAPIPARATFPLRDENTLDVPDEWMRVLYEPWSKAIRDAINGAGVGGGV